MSLNLCIDMVVVIYYITSVCANFKFDGFILVNIFV